MILLYLVRPGNSNEELRYSLRSAARNLDVDEVWTVGYQPLWLTNVRHIPGNTGPSKQVNVYNNLRAACAHPAIPQDAVVMNDDFFILTRTPEIPVWYRGSLHGHIESLGRRNDWWSRSMRATRLWLEHRGHTSCRSFELHLPFPVDTGKMGTVLTEAADYQPGNPPQWRTLYGNRWEVPAVQIFDVKIERYGTLQPAAGMLSTTDTSWVRSPAAAAVRAMFPKQSPYERTP